MFESLLHFLGLCPDHASHVSLLDFIVGGAGVYLAGGWGLVKAFVGKKGRKG